MPIRAAVFTAPGQPLTIEEFERPQLQTGEVLVRVDCCTVCGSDLRSLRGDRAVPTPTILGHEILGTVIEVCETPPCDLHGQPVVVGDRMTWGVAASCGTCDRCQQGIPQKCRSLFKYGHEPSDKHPLSGGLAECCHLRVGTPIVKLGDELSDLEACPASCATATVAAAFRVAGDIQDRSVLIFGAGMLGLTAAAMAKVQGAESVIVCDLDPQRLLQASRFGATHTLSWIDDSEEMSSAVRSIAGDDGVDVVLEMSGANSAIDVSPRLLKIGGRFVLVGSVAPSGTVPFDPEQIVRRLLRIEGIHNYTPTDLAIAVDFLTAHHQDFPFESLVARTFTLDEVNDAITFAQDTRPCRVAIVPNLN
ncbi:MAG: zinc-binding dehydrogenase [Planctomycetaceae bacterium]|nr:zinc-binding dehydrogenase [Planctomycetaceae bacterium]